MARSARAASTSETSELQIICLSAAMQIFPGDARVPIKIKNGDELSLFSAILPDLSLPVKEKKTFKHFKIFFITSLKVFDMSNQR